MVSPTSLAFRNKLPSLSNEFLSPDKFPSTWSKNVYGFFPPTMAALGSTYSHHPSFLFLPPLVHGADTEPPPKQSRIMATTRPCE